MYTGYWCIYSRDILWDRKYKNSNIKLIDYRSFRKSLVTMLKSCDIDVSDDDYILESLHSNHIVINLTFFKYFATMWIYMSRLEKKYMSWFKISIHTVIYDHHLGV